MRSSRELLTAATAMACMAWTAACGQTVEAEGTVTGFDQRERVTVEAARWVQVDDDSWPPQYGTEYRNLRKEIDVDCNPVDDNQFKSSDDGECRRDPGCFAGAGKHCEVVSRTTMIMKRKSGRALVFVSPNRANMNFNQIYAVILIVLMT